ncbi:MAG TPA: histidine phosphatase family protein [Anaerolineaceae bacterium]|nr:histidine phosphatase family protein [Anaerolineaceae bacterium]
MTIIYMVRHGKTDDTGKRITGYRPGIHLNDEGIHHASLASGYLKASPIRSVYASPLERTMETASIIAANHNLPVHSVDFLKELDFGVYQGKGEELVIDPLWQSFQRDPASVTFPKGESVQQAQSRIVEGIVSLNQIHTDDDEIVCVSHCEVIRLALAYAMDIPIKNYMELTIDTGSISKVVWNAKQQTAVFINVKYES